MTRATTRGRRLEQDLTRLQFEIRACRRCLTDPTGAPLPHEPRPVIRGKATARIAICGQAPGTRVHASGIPFTDPSGVRLRAWMGLSEVEFYDEAVCAVVPMGFCFPGLSANGSDLPPRRECAALWRARVFAALPQVELILAIGQYAQRWHLGPLAQRSLTETVADWKSIVNRSEAGPAVWPLPHPSWRNSGWLKHNPWFSAEVLPQLRSKITSLLRQSEERLTRMDR